jgi:hypothetical protein
VCYYVLENLEVEIHELTFEKCISAIDGGGLYTRFLSDGSLTMSGIISFEDCNAT